MLEVFLSAPTLLKEVDVKHCDFGKTEGFLLVYRNKDGGWALGDMGRIKRPPAGKAYSRCGRGPGGGRKKFSLSPLCDKALRGRTATLRLCYGIRGYAYGVYSTSGIARNGEGLCVLDGKGLGLERGMNSNVRFALNEYPDTHTSLPFLLQDAHFPQCSIHSHNTSPEQTFPIFRVV